jgi:glycosyltransferase involved in cell wall biosynthesis
MKKKLCIICYDDITIRIMLIAQVEAALKAGYEIHGVCSESEYFDYLRQRGIKMHAVSIKKKISPFSDLAAFWKMYKYLKKEKIDIVHTHSAKCSLLGQLTAKLAGVPVIVNTVHGFYFHEYMRALSRSFYIALEWIAARCSTVILSQNSEDVETAIKLGICKRDKIKLLGNGVDLNKFNPARFDNEFMKSKRAEIGVPENALVIAIIGRLVCEKGYLELFEASKHIMIKHDNVWLVIVGPEEPEKADRISAGRFKEYGIGSRTRWLGACENEDVPGILSCCDIFTLPSWREGFPRSAIEACAMSLPIVVTNIRGCRQVVTDGTNGLLVYRKKADDLEKALILLVKDEELRKKMGIVGYNKAQEEFDEQKVCQIVMDTYEELLSRRE